MNKHYLGIEIGGSKLQVFLAHDDLKPIKTFRIPIDRSEGASSIKTAIKNCLVDLAGIPIARIGVGFGGPINKKTGEIFTSYHIAGWTGFSIKSWLEDISGCEVVVDNDANAAALAEAVVGAGKNEKRVFYITLGSGVGAGLAIDKKIYHGSEPGEMEFGHLRLERSGPPLQDLCSGWAVNQKILKLLAENADSSLNILVQEFPGHESKALGRAIAMNDLLAKRIVSETMNDLSYGLSHAIHLLHPDVIILGGGLSLLGNVLAEEVEKSLPDYLMDAFQPGPPIRISLLQESAVPLGAILLASTTQQS